MPEERERGGVNRRAEGKKGEDRAAAWLEGQGMSIIARNFHSSAGEVDIIALEGETVVFVEVKTWSVYTAESLDWGIGAKKQRRIIETAKYFLSMNRKYSSMAVRFDVLFINRDVFNHFPSAFIQ